MRYQREGITTKLAMLLNICQINVIMTLLVLKPITQITVQIRLIAFQQSHGLPPLFLLDGVQEVLCKKVKTNAHRFSLSILLWDVRLSEMVEILRYDPNNTAYISLL